MNIRDKIPLIDICSVIGNGPSDTDLSREIDSSYVIRCNNFKLTPLTGTITDLNITALYTSATGHLPYPIFGVLPMSPILYEKYSNSEDMHVGWRRVADRYIKHGNEVWTYGEGDDFAEIFREVTEEIDAFPTTGLMGIALARWIGFPTIILSGFTFFSIVYDRKVTPHHKPNAERELVKRWIDFDERYYILDNLVQYTLYDN